MNIVYGVVLGVIFVILMTFITTILDKVLDALDRVIWKMDRTLDEEAGISNGWDKT